MPDEERMSGNKGEWSELYVFLRLLAKGRIYAANDKAERIESVYYPILKIFREDRPGDKIDYIIDGDDVIIETYNRNPLLNSAVSRAEIQKVSDRLFEEIQTHENAFELNDISDYVKHMGVSKLKAPSEDKSDITVQMRDVHSGFVMNEGFSIKSEVGAAPTLINAGESTNFIYRVRGITDKQAEEINNINSKYKIKKRMERLRELGGALEYVEPAHKTFKRNLIMVDGDMARIIGEMLLYSYTYDVYDCSEIIKAVGLMDPLGYGNGETIIYESKFKRFLCDCALGMKPASRWDGCEEANGGYIIVKSTGEILAYTLYNRDAFKQYLFDNTIFERASTTRHKYMNLYKEGDEMFLKLNLQIRFKKS